MLYVGVYILFILLIMTVVNMVYIMPIENLFKDDHSFATTIASVLYYFYIVPGKILKSFGRILLHLLLIVFVTIIALFIVQNNPQNEDTTINYDYSEKKNIRRQLNNFTLILWILTSIVAFSAKL
jgi:hypothetical protein